MRSHNIVAPFRVEVHREGDSVRVAPAGELDLATADTLQARLHELRDENVREIVLDLREIDCLDSIGMKLILNEDRFARRNARIFSLIAGPPAVQRVLEICGLADRLRFRNA